MKKSLQSLPPDLKMTLAIGLALFVLALTACSQRNDESANTMFPTDEMTAFVQQIADSLHAETISVSLYDLETGATFQHNEKTMLHAASTMKVPVMIELFRQAEAGAFSIDDSIMVRNSFRSIVDESEYAINEDSEKTLYEKIGHKVAIRDLMSLMITWSSNLATNLLIELVDAKSVTSTMRELGAPEIQVLRGVEDIKAYRKGWSNRTTAYDMMMVMRAIAENKAASADACSEMIEILKQQHFTEGIGSGLPEGVATASKSGAITAIQHDCGIVYPAGRKPYVLVVLTKGIAVPENAQKAIAAISQKVYRTLNPTTSD